MAYYPIITFSSESEDESKRLVKKKKCFIKLYKDNSFTDVDKEKFYKLRIFSKPHKKNKKYSIFRYENKTYVTPTNCLVREDLDPDDFEINEDELLDSEPAENNEKINRAASYREFSRNLGFDENKYFIELGSGIVMVGDDSPISEEIKNQDTTGNEIPKESYDIKPSKYKAKTVVNVALGWKISSGHFFTLRYKGFKGEKEEVVDLKDAQKVDVKRSFDDSFSSFLLGQKFVFMQEYVVRPILYIEAGFNSINSKLKSSQGQDVDYYKLQASSFTLIGQLGLEVMFTNNFGIHAMGGYQYLGKQTFRLKDKEKDGETLDIGFRSGQSYSNTFINFGAQVYF